MSYLGPKQAPLAPALIVVLLIALLPMRASGWSNGPDGPNSYGTHDWILDKALQATDVSWVDDERALEATDDPDTVDGIDHASGTWWHVYDEWGDTYGGAPEAIAYWYGSISTHLTAGELEAASVELGYLAHLLGDLAQPMHTDSSKKEDMIHSKYEGEVDRKVAAGRLSFTFDGADPFDPYESSLALARRSHDSYIKLVKQYSEFGYNRNVRQITRRQLNAAANVMADALASLPAPTAASPPPTPSVSNTPSPLLSATASPTVTPTPSLGATPTPKPTSAPTPKPSTTPKPTCDPAYPTVCISPPPPDLDCGDVPHRDFAVVKHPDPHGFDGDNDGSGCES